MTDTGQFEQTLTFVIPAKNEAATIADVITNIKMSFPSSEVIVVNDGSTDNTKTLASQAGATVVNHPYSKGNGASIKSGARIASGDVLIFLDADGQHTPQDAKRLIDKLNEGYDMVVGARGPESQASNTRRLGNAIYNRLASWMTGNKIEDLTSGFRAVKSFYFRRYLYLLPNGFSYPTTSTMAFFRSGLSVGYVPISVKKREGKSHIKIVKDGSRFLIIIFKIGALFSPMRFFLPIAITLFSLGSLYYGYTYITDTRFTNMSALLFQSSLIIFLMGIVSEQVSSLHYKSLERESWKKPSSKISTPQKTGQEKVL